MLEKFFSNTARDYHQRYEGTYGFFTSDSNVRKLVRLARVVTDDDRPFIDFVDDTGASYRLLADSDRGFEFIPPKSAWYNTSGGAAYVQRMAQRQWTRGVSRRNTQIFSLNGGELRPVPVDFPYLTEIYAVDTKTDVNTLRKSGLSFALTADIAVDPKTKVLYVLNQPIGQFTETKGDVNIFNVKLEDKSLWQTEILDAFKRNNLKAEIV